MSADGLKSSTRSSPHPVDVAKLRADLEAYMERHGLRSTEQRRLIVDAFFDTREHVSIEQVLTAVRQADPRVGYATVYRTMKLLAASGVAIEQHFGDGYTRYELADAHSHHDHLICLDCGRIIEFEEPGIQALQRQVAERHGFEVREHKHELYGVCRACQKRPVSDTEDSTAG